MNGLDLFSGIGGLSIGLSDYVRTIAYCESDRHARAVLLSRMAEGRIDCAPICDDVQHLRGNEFPHGSIDIIFGGFPCQDISTAGHGRGLDGKRSGLFFEIMRLAKEIKPAFLFLENVPAIRTRGLDRVISEFAAAGYDCRWTMLAASDVGAPHKRQRWFLLAHAQSDRNKRTVFSLSGTDAAQKRSEEQNENAANQFAGASEHANVLANSQCMLIRNEQGGFGWAGRSRETQSRNHGKESWWTTEPNLGRVVNGVPQRLDRIKRLGNAVVPAQAKAAFEMLMMGRGVA